jgi:hypothetical protein
MDLAKAVPWNTSAQANAKGMRFGFMVFSFD